MEYFAGELVRMLSMAGSLQNQPDHFEMRMEIQEIRKIQECKRYRSEWQFHTLDSRTIPISLPTTDSNAQNVYLLSVLIDNELCVCYFLRYYHSSCRTAILALLKPSIQNFPSAYGS